MTNNKPRDIPCDIDSNGGPESDSKGGPGSDLGSFSAKVQIDSNGGYNVKSGLDPTQPQTPSLESCDLSYRVAKG